MIFKWNSVFITYFIEYHYFFCEKKTFDNTVEKHIINFMSLPVVFSSTYLSRYDYHSKIT